MRGPTCRSVERPPTKVAMLVNHSLDGVTLGARQHDARSTHQSSGNASEPRVWFTNCASIVCPAPGVARHPRAVGCPRQKKSQRVGVKDRASSVGHAKKCTHVYFVCQEAPGGSPGTPGVNTIPVAMPMERSHRRLSAWQLVSAATRSPPASAGGFYSGGPAAVTKSPGRKPGDTVSEHRPAGHAYGYGGPTSFGVATGIRRHAVSPGFRRGLCVRRCGGCGLLRPAGREAARSRPSRGRRR
jgi:hypothetical protein